MITTTDYSPFFAIIEVAKQQKEQKQEKNHAKYIRANVPGEHLQRCSRSMEDKKPALIELLETHIEFETMRLLQVPNLQRCFLIIFAPYLHDLHKE